MCSSDLNEVLTGLAVLDELSNGGVVPVLIKDNSGNSIWGAAEAWIVKMPDSEYAKEAGAREWKIQCAELIGVEGGN